MKLPWPRRKTKSTSGAPHRSLQQRLSTLVIDFGNPAHRRALLLFNLVVLAGLTAIAVAGYQGYMYTESAEFCGDLCHVMEPEYSRFEVSQHANVECVECHIGPGMSFFVRSKIDGLRQVYAVLTDSYSRPIPSPVHNLRPAREICEQCHTPTAFKDNIIKNVVHYLPDEENTPMRTTLILKMGGWQETTGISDGIHWHISAPVYYIAADEQRQVILWVGVQQPDGNMKEFFSRDMLTIGQTSFVDDAFENGEVRRMDCIDCHNRTAHLIPHPEMAVDLSISAGRISRELPYIRARAVEVLSANYESEKQALQAIQDLRAFYAREYPEVAREKADLLEQAIAEISRIYQQTHFPEMKLSWQTYPNNERHTPFMGCFRCHDDKHVRIDERGNELQAISVKCNLCHTVPIVGKGDEQLVEAPVITGPVPASHEDYSWTIEHRSTSEAEQQEDCFQCHGQNFCNNGACHNLEHPEDMVYTHAEEYDRHGDQVCFTCHQNYVLCSRCHPGGIVENP